jgi:hypothetical protein
MREAQTRKFTRPLPAVLNELLKFENEQLNYRQPKIDNAAGNTSADIGV